MCDPSSQSPELWQDHQLPASLEYGHLHQDSVSRDAETSTDGVSATLMQRTALLFHIAALLKRLAHDHGLVVLLVNQVCPATRLAGTPMAVHGGKNLGARVA